jgi:hypothetical protein
MHARPRQWVFKDLRTSSWTDWPSGKCSGPGLDKVGALRVRRFIPELVENDRLIRLHQIEEIGFLARARFQNQRPGPRDLFGSDLL